MRDQAALLFAFLIGTASAFYEKGGAVQLLTAKSFSTVHSFPGISVVEFYAPWCGYVVSALHRPVF